MGKRRRKLLRRKYAKLSWNKYNELHPNKDTQKEQITEQKITKVVEDNSVILERMKNMSSALDEVLQNFDTEPEPIMTIQPFVEEVAVETPVELKPEPPPIIIAKPTQINLNKKTKKVLIGMAKDLGISVKSSDTKATIIKAIELNNSKTKI